MTVWPGLGRRESPDGARSTRSSWSPGKRWRRICADRVFHWHRGIGGFYRRRGIGRLLVSRAEELSNYYNCHKVSVAVFHERAAQTFFTACGYKIDAVIPQHTFKLDVALLRKFLL